LSNRKSPNAQLAVPFICFSFHAIDNIFIEHGSQGKVSPRPIFTRGELTNILTEIVPQDHPENNYRFPQGLLNIKNIYMILILREDNINILYRRLGGLDIMGKGE
jgi:hypothetical protein